MKPATLAAAALSLCVSLVSAGVVTIPIRADQVVEKSADDCFFGVVTPMGCGYVLFPPPCPQSLTLQGFTCVFDGSLCPNRV